MLLLNIIYAAVRYNIATVRYNECKNRRAWMLENPAFDTVITSDVRGIESGNNARERLKHAPN